MGFLEIIITITPLGNNNNNNPLPLSPPEFKGGLGFNPPPEGNARRLNPNIVALVNVLTGVNLGINYTEKESNHIKLIEFEGTEAEDPNEWLE